MSTHEELKNEAEQERMREQRLREDWVECIECKDIFEPDSDDALQISDNGLCVVCDDEKFRNEVAGL
jgi:hypothetical protein